MGGSKREGEGAGLSLQGVGVAVTRHEEEGGAWVTALADLGARVHLWTTIAFAPPEDPAPLWEALDRLGVFDWICFTSPRAVEAVVGRTGGAPEGVRVAAVGPATRAALEAVGWPVHRVGEPPTAEGLVAAFREAGDARGARVLFPASALARPTLAEGLRALGAEVHQVTAYRTVHPPLDGERCLREVGDGHVRAVTFTSPSSVEGLRKALGEEGFRALARSLPAAALGPTTARALEEMGWARVAVARVPTPEALAWAVVEVMGRTGKGVGGGGAG